MNPVFTAHRYIKYRLKSFSLHGVHSPFIFDFNNTVLNDKTPFYAFQYIESLRSRMLLNNSTFNKKDWGTGNRNGLVRVSQIANRDLLPSRYGQVLFKMVNYYRPEKILEMGTSLGITTLYLSTPNQNARVITLEGCPETMRLAQEHFDKLNAKNITPIVGEFSSTLPDALSKLGKLDFLYLDGNHSYKPTLDYFEKCLPYCHEDSILVFDDIHLNKGMEQAWDEIRNHQKVTIGIDLFKLGIVFFKSGMPNQQFTLKF